VGWGTESLKQDLLYLFWQSIITVHFQLR